MEKIIFINADVVTMDDTCESARAFGIMGDRFTVVGSEEKVKHWGGAGASCITSLTGPFCPGCLKPTITCHFSACAWIMWTAPPPPNTQIEQVLGKLKDRAGPEVVRAYQELARENKLGVRAYLTLLHTLFDQYQDLGVGMGFGTDMVRIGSAKLLQDGSIQGHTGWLSEPYYDKQEEGHVSQPIMTQETLDELVEKYHCAGMQIAVHGNGDAAIESIILAVEKAQKKHPIKDPRHLLIHCQTVREDQIPRMKAAGLMPSYFIQHVYYWGDRHRDIFLGPERAARINPLASSLKQGVIFTLHSDLPITPMEPLHAIHTAVNRTTRNGFS